MSNDAVRILPRSLFDSLSGRGAVYHVPFVVFVSSSSALYFATSIPKTTARGEEKHKSIEELFCVFASFYC